MNSKNRIRKLAFIQREAEGFDTITNSLSSWLKTIIDPAHPIESIAQLLLEGMIFTKWGWIPGIIAGILDKGFGINVGSFWRVIKSVVVPFMQRNQGQPVDVNSAATDLASKVISGLNVSPTDIHTPFDSIMAENPELAAQGALLEYRITKRGGIGTFLGMASLAGLIKSIIKALLIGAGFSLAGGAMVSGFTGKPMGAQKSENELPQASPQNQKPKYGEHQTLINYAGKPSAVVYNGQSSNAKRNNSAGVDGKPERSAWYYISNGEFEDFLRDLVFGIYKNMDGRVVDFINKNFDAAAERIKSQFADWNRGIDIDEMGENVRVPSAILCPVGEKKLESFKDIADLVLAQFVVGGEK